MSQLNSKCYVTPKKVTTTKTVKTPKKCNQDPVEVFCRLRPLKSVNESTCLKRLNDHTLQLCLSSSNRLKSFYTFKYVFPDTTTQKDLFDRIGAPLVRDLIDGKNGLLFTYGITSSGKTFTLTGNSQNCGVLPRTLDVLFNSVGDNLCRKFTFSPDGTNGFKVRSPPDALMEWQKYKQVSRTPSAVTSTPRVTRRENDDLKEWEQRFRDETKIDLDSKGSGFGIFISYIEIYNNYIYDLLDEEIFSDGSERRQPQSKVLREDKRKKVFVWEAKEIEIHSADEAFDLFVRGVGRRRMAHTALNTESSRSHSVFNIRVVQAPLDADGDVITDVKFVTISQLSLVDLAGSERTHRTKNTGERLREAGNINNSLMALRTCIELLRENQKLGVNKIIPYRDNKLTHLFKSYFEGEGKIKMIICINPGSADFDETLHVMKFAETAQEVLINRANDIPFHLRTPHPYSSPKFIPYPSVDAPFETIGPPLPTLTSIDKKQLADLIETLELRKKNTLRQYELLRQKQMLFRESLISTESENMLSKQQLKILRNDVAVHENQVKTLESKCSLLESEQEENMRKIYSLERHLQQVKEQLDQKNQALNYADIQCEETKAATKEKIAREKERLQRVFEKVLRDKQAQLEREQCLTKEKMHLVKEILTADNSDWGVFREYWDSMYPNINPSTPNTGTKTIDSNENGIKHIFHSRRPSLPESTQSTLTSTPQKRSTPNKNPPIAKPRNKTIHKNGNNNGGGGDLFSGFNDSLRPSVVESIDQTPSKATFDKTSTPSTSKRLKLSSEPGTSMMCPSSVIPNYEPESQNCENLFGTNLNSNIPVVNPRYMHSLSIGNEKWIDHRPQHDLDMGTVLRPKIKNKISVTNLKNVDADELKRASKYAITTHTADDRGDVETRIYKGEVIPSSAGGAQVIFNDVETMVQSPSYKLHNSNIH